MDRVRALILASGSGTLTQALLDAYGPGSGGGDVEIVAIGSDNPAAGVLDRARAAGVESFVCALADSPTRAEWNETLARTVAAYSPDWVVCAGFMKILGETFINAFPSRIINTHPALLPSFPGAHAVRDALAHGVKVTGSTIHLVDAGVDTGPIIVQVPVAISDDDTEDSLHESIRKEERAALVRLVGFLGNGQLRVSGRRVVGYQVAPQSFDAP